MGFQYLIIDKSIRSEPRKMPRKQYPKPKRKSNSLQTLKNSVIKIIQILIFGGVTVAIFQQGLPFLTANFPKSGCNIKGNISVNSGKRWYHLPGMEDYETTNIDPSKGERWFCSEAEAISNGWKKAPR